MVCLVLVLVGIAAAGWIIDILPQLQLWHHQPTVKEATTFCVHRRYEAMRLVDDDGSIWCSRIEDGSTALRRFDAP